MVTEDEMVNGITCMMDVSLSRLWELMMDREASCCSPWGCKESDMAERLNSHTHTHISLGSLACCSSWGAESDRT